MGLETIVDAAERLLERRGAGFTMDELAAEAGVSRATVYRRISGREGLARQLRARGIEPGPALGGSTHRRILDAVRAVIDAHQLSFTIEDVAREAGVGTATIYRRFGDREGLLRAYLGRTSPRATAAEQLAELDAPVAATLTAFVASVLRFVLEHPGLVQIALFDEGPSAQQLQRLRQGGRGTFARLVDYFEAQIQRGRLRPAEPRQLAISFVGMVLGSSLLGVRLPVIADEPTASPRSVQERAAELVELFLGGAATPEESRS